MTTATIEKSYRAEVWGAYMQRIAGGDSGALSSLYDESSGLTFALALRILRNRADAEEVVLDSFMQVWRRATQYSADRGSAQTWLLTIVRNRAIDRLRSRAATERPAEDLGTLRSSAMPAAPGATPEESSVLAEQRRQVARALEKLPQSTRTALELAYFDGLSHSEIAERLGEPLGTVKTRIRRGLQVLRSVMPGELAC